MGHKDPTTGLVTNESAHGCSVLIGTYEVLGVSYTLTKAFRVFYFDPAFKDGDEDQAEGRVKRVTQRNPRTEAFGFQFTNSAAETELRRRRAARSEPTAEALGTVLRRDVRLSEVRVGADGLEVIDGVEVIDLVSDSDED